MITNPPEEEVKTLHCQDCGNDFEFPVREQEFFEENGWPNPIRCKDCQKKRKQLRESFKNKN